VKTCTKCLLSKDIDQFYKRKAYKDGHSTWCMSCALTYGKAYKKPRLQERLEKQRTWRKTTNYCRDYLSNPSNKLAHTLRVRINDILKERIKVGSAVNDLGCSIDMLKQHLESKFQLGMTWENHSVDGWHVDHIVPLSKFDLTIKEEFQKACHYTNLQPLWAKDNLVKYNNVR